MKAPQAKRGPVAHCQGGAATEKKGRVRGTATNDIKEKTHSTESVHKLVIRMVRLG